MNVRGSIFATPGGTGGFAFINIASGLPIFSASGYSVGGRFTYGFSSGNIGTLYCEDTGAGNALWYVAVTVQTLTTSTLSVKIRDNSNVNQLNFVASTQKVSINQWHNFVWTDNNGTCALYIDGVLDSTNFNYTPTSYTFARSSIGVIRTGPTNALKGGYSSFFACPYIVSAAQIAAFHKANAMPTPANGIWPLDDGIALNVRDISGKGNKGTIQTRQRWSADLPTPLKQQRKRVQRSVALR